MPTATMLPLRAAPPCVIGCRRIVGFRPAVAPYSRAADLARLLPLWPEELADATVEGRTRLVRMLERALRAERQRGAGGHWTYDLSRHAQLMWALRAERAELDSLRRPAMTASGRSASQRNTVAARPRDLAPLP
jgi:Family of unknown function (DUF6477)